MDSGSDEGSDEEYTNGHGNLTNGHLENGVSDGSEGSEEEKDNDDSASEEEGGYDNKQQVENGDSASEDGSEGQNDNEGGDRDSGSEVEENGHNEQGEEEDEVSSMSDEPAEEERKDVRVKASEENRDEARESDDESDNGEEMEVDEGEEDEGEDEGEENGEREDQDEDEEQESPTKSTGSDEEDSSPVSKKGRGRPKKQQVVDSDDETASKKNKKQMMKDEEIARSLNDSNERSRSRKASRKVAVEDDDDEDNEPLGKRTSKYDDDDDFEDDGGDEEEDEEIESEDEDSDEQPKKRRKIEEDEDNSRRRSGRERKAPKKFEVEKEKPKKKKKRRHESSSGHDESDSDYDMKQRKKGRKKKTKKKAKPKAKVKAPERAKRKRTKVQSSDENSDASADDISEDEGTVKRYKAKMKKQKGKAKISRQDYEDKQSERHKGKQRVTYADDDTSHESDIDEEYDAKHVEVEDEDIEQVGFVLDYRTGKKGATGESTMHFTVQEHGDPNITLETEETEDQYLIKWDGWAHFNNTWESLHSLENRPNNKPVKGFRKVHNYINKVREYVRWKKMASPEDVEYQEIEVQLGRNLLQTYLDPERIFAEKKNPETGGTDYFVKWKNLPYSESTWEDPSIVKSYYPSYLEEYLARKKSKSNPKNYKETVKLISKKTWKPMKEQPEYIGSETLRLRDYQMDGINFLLDAWHKGNSMILADEMGLGKTIQTICFLKYLFHNYKFKGPMLVSVPLSTLAAWQKEFETWAPEMNVIAYIGDGKSREIIRQYECEDQESGELIFNVLLTNYEMVGKDRDFFVDIAWSNIVIDEAHRLKNHESLLYKVLVDIESHHRLLLTGTPLQNSLKELWCLLNYIQIPELDPWEVFEANYGSKQDQAQGYVKLHTLLKPFIIRRLKKDVEKSLPGKVERILRVDMTVAQKRMYKNVLTRNFEVLSKGKNQISLLNLMMQLRKTCNHSHLLMEPDDIPQNDADRCKQLVYGSGKLVLLDKLLARFREKGDRVLIFSQMVTMLNIIEEYLLLRRYQFQRLDGSVGADKRKQSIARFNDKDSSDFCFLLSTKAGGLGINLQTANRVIIFDSDFNPQNDLQAIARAHRIGQKEEVKIYRLVSSNSVDEDIIQRAKNKMVLDHLVIQRMDTTGKTIIGGVGVGGSEKDKGDGKNLSKQDLNMILKFGAEELFKAGEEEENEDDGNKIDLDAILEQAEVREEADDDAHQSEANKELLGAFKCTTLTFEETENEEKQPEPPKKETKNWDDIIPEDMRQVEKKEPTLSDLEELYKPIGHRKRKRAKRRFEDDSAENSKVNTPVGSTANTPVGSSYENSDDESEEDSGNDSEMEIELKKALKQKERKGEARGNYNKKNFMCTKCGKTYTDKKGVVVHMSVKHQEPNYVLTEDNYIELPENGLDDNSNKSGDGAVKKRGKKPMNTRCFPCGKAFAMRPGYKAHIKKVHDNIEPPENTDPANLALPDNRISCLICAKKFSNKNGLRHHISRVHLGIATKNDKGSGSEDEDEKDDAVSVEQDPLADPLGDVPADNTETETDPEPSPENPNPFTCAVTHCSSAFPAKAFLLLHIKTQHPGVDTSEITLNTKLKLLSNGNSASNSVKSDTESLPQSQVTEEEMVLIEKMMNSMRKYGCSLCEQRFTSKEKMTRHEKQHAKGNPVVCPYCGKSYSRRDKLVTHCKNMHTDKPIPAPAIRSSPGKGIKKKEKKSTPKILSKKADDTVVEDPDVVKVEVKFEKAANSERIKCPKCNLTFAFMKGAQRHLKQVHGPPRAFKCKECPLSYHDYKGLYQHTSRIHKRKSADGRDGANSNSDSVESDSAGSFVVDENGLDVEPADRKFKCQGCPKAFSNSGQLYLHKKTAHPHLIRTYANSPLVNKDGTPVTETSVPLPPSATKKFPCKQCPRIYGSYMSLYMHRKTKHPKDGSDSPARNGASNGVTVINLGAPAGNQDQKKPHQCLSCPKRYTDLKGLSKHIEEVHNAPVIVQPTFAPSPDKESQKVQCPYCPKIYSRRDKVNQHIRSVHPDQEVPRSPVKVASNVLKPIGITPMSNGIEEDDIICLDDDMGGGGDDSISNTSKGNMSGRGKYKEKAFRCPECNKGYCDKKRLDVHMENRHTVKSDDPFADVGPNTDIAVSSNSSEIGYEVYKVIGVYTTGIRFKCAKYSPISHDRWTLTEEINKNVMKVNIMKVLKTLKKDQVEKNVYTMDMDELVSLMQTASVDNGEKEIRNDENEDEDNDEMDDVDDSKEITGVDENGLHSEIDLGDGGYDVSSMNYI